LPNLIDIKGFFRDRHEVSAIELLICAVLVLISAYLSSSEIALFSLSRFQLRSLKERFRASHRKIKRLLADPGGLLVTILVINEIVNIALSSIITGSIARNPKADFLQALPIPVWALNTVLGLLITTPIVLFFCEITPKVVAARANRLIAPLTAGPLTVIYEIFKPVRLTLQFIVKRVARWTTRQKKALPASGQPNQEDQTDPKLLRESDFMMMIEEGHKEGAIQQSELDLIKNVFELDDTTVGEVFTPLVQVQTLSEKTTLRNSLNTMRSQKYSRIPITAANSTGSRRQVVGVLYSKDLLRAKLEPELMSLTVDTIMRRPLFVSPAIRLNALFRKFKQQKTHMGVVQGPGGEALGIVTMSDVLDALFEDLLPDEEEGRDK
jgi:putative hemolysin